MIHTDASRIQSRGIRKVSSEWFGVNAGSDRSARRLGIGVKKRSDRTGGRGPRKQGRYLDDRRFGLAQPCSFVRDEHEGLVLLNRSSQESAEVIVSFGSARLPRLVCKPIVGIENIIAKVFVDASVKIIGARDRSSQESAEVIVSFGSARLPRLVCKPIVGIENIIAKVFVDASVKIIGARTRR